ncbi:MAG: InlB B-repeat-containing protein, partial [Galactobacillus timonensis]|uniref:InlB B-repeat-containing protein n=1 Tax=Galactobacillus timonensis TaxID=2041840 RepID=UPI0024095712
MKKNHRSIRDTAFCSILSVAMFFSLGVNSIAEESGDPSAAQPGTEVTETVENPSPEPEPAPEVPAEAAAVTEPEPAPEATPEVTEEVPAAPEETAAPEPTPTEVKAEEPAVPEETPAPAESMAPAETAVPEETAEPEPTPEATPETEEESADIYMPAGSFYGSTSKMTVTVTYDDHTFPQGTTMRVSDVSHSEAMAAAEQSTEGDEEVIDAVAVDITFLNANNEEIQPEGAVSVSMVPYTPLETTETSTTEVIHKDDSGSVETVGNADVSASGAEFSAEHFSIYVIKSTSDPAIATYIFHDAAGKEISTQKVKNGETVYAPTTPEKNGYKFLGWSYTQNVSAVQSGDPGDFTTLNPSVTVTTDVKLYPVFQQVYYVFFMDDQGRVSTTKEGVSGATIKVSDVKIPLDSTHSVTGWYTEAEFTNKVDSVTLTDHNVTLYPKVEQGHYLYFASGEGASYVEPEFVAANEETKAPAKPTRPGYTFSHWSLSEEGPESEYSFGSTISENTTLYAVWNANTNTKYTVIYWWENANDDNYSYHEGMVVENGESGKKIEIDDSLVKTYDGFSLDEEKTNAANTDKTISGDGSTIINIYYSRNEYQVKFYQSTEHGDWWHGYTYSWDELTDLRITAKYGANISNRWPTSTSKIWGTKQGDNGQGTSPYQSGISTMPLNGAAFYYVSQNGRYTMNLNYYLEGLDGTYSLHHTDSFKSNNNGWTTKEDHYDIEGFTYTNNVKDGTSFEKVSRYVYQVHFEYSRNSYSIKFVNGSSTTSKTFKYGADISKVDLTVAPERPAGIPSGYVFAGWFDNELGVGDPATLTGTMPAHNITLYAKWAAPTCEGKIFLTIDGSGEPQTFNIDYGSTIDEEKMPSVNVPEGYTWVGWATKSGNDFILFNFDTKVYVNITLYPYYVNGVKYSVTYDLSAGTGTVPIDSKKYAENSYADIQSASGITPPDGKTFLYWTSSDNTNYYPGDKVKITGNLELTASYGDTSKLTSITYNSNYPADSGLTAETKTVDGQANNTAITLDKAGFTAPDGYYFSYWKDASGTQYPVGTKIGIDNNTTSTNDLYAVWEKKKEITLKANSGTFTYDGSTHGVSGVETDQFTIDGITYTVSGYKTTDPAEINAGTYDNIVSGTFVVKNGDADVSERFTVKTENGKLTITQAAELTITITGKNATETYDGNEKSVSGYDVTTT